MVAASVASPMNPETFSFVSPAAWPLTSGSLIALDVFDSTWAPAGFRVRVDHNSLITPPKKKEHSGLATYEIGGPNARVWVSGPFSAGYPAYPGDDPAERIFAIVKVVGGVAAGPGEVINSGDQVALRIDSNWGKTFFFRVTGPQSGAEVHGDGTALGQAGTGFIAEFNEVQGGVGWRPRSEDVRCQVCAVVTAKVTRVGAANFPIRNAIVVAQVPNHPFDGLTGIDGLATLFDAQARNCIPEGPVQIQGSANRHQTKTVTAAVPGVGAIQVPIQLECTQVKGKVVDAVGSSVPGVTVVLRDQNRDALLDENGNPFQTTTAADGSFVFNCVPHEFVQVWTLAAPSQMQHTKVLGPEGWTNVTIVIQAPQSCGNLVGRVTDAATGQPISGATVTEAGGGFRVTNANGEFTFQCLTPAGPNQVWAAAVGYRTKSGNGVVPTTGNSSPVNIQLERLPTAVEVQIRLDWGAQPSDLDSHLSGPDGAGGRFHCSFRNLQPVPFIQLDADDTTAFGPETITIRSVGVALVAGSYRYWVHNYTGTTFAGSNASVSVAAADAQGALTQIARWDVINASGSPADDIWHVANVDIDANGNVTRADIQAFLPGDSNTQL